MVVDQKCAVGVARLGEAGEMDFPDPLKRKGVEIRARVKAVVDGVDMDIIHVEQQAAAGALRKLGQKLRFVECIGCKPQIGRRIFDQNRTAQRRLGSVDFFCDAAAIGLVIGQG